MPVTKTDGKLVLALVRGDDRLEEAKLATALGSDFRPGDGGRDPRGVRRRPRLARTGRLLGRGRGRRGPARGAVRRRARTAPASTSEASSRDATSTARFADLRQPREGDACPQCGGALRLPDRDRGRAHLQVRDALFRAARRQVPRRGRQGEAARGGSYGIGPARMLAAVVEQQYDEEKGMRLAGVDRAVRRARRRPARARGRGCADRGEARRRRPRRCCSTTATCERARSSRTPT